MYEAVAGLSFLMLWTGSFFDSYRAPDTPDTLFVDRNRARSGLAWRAVGCGGLDPDAKKKPAQTGRYAFWDLA